MGRDGVSATGAGDARSTQAQGGKAGVVGRGRWRMMQRCDVGEANVLERVGARRGQPGRRGYANRLRATPLQRPGKGEAPE